VQQQVTVADVAPLIDQETAGLGATLQPEQFVELPIEGRNAYSLVVLAPGVNPKGNAGTGPLINGGRSNANAVLLDGGQVLNSTTNDTSYTPPLEAVEQFKVNTSSFQAEYGRTAGGVLNVTTKMGTNQIHGALYEYFRNDALNANTYSNDLVGLSKAIVRHNEFGGAAGGPVWLPGLYHGRDRTFFFLALEFVPDRSAVLDLQRPHRTRARRRFQPDLRRQRQAHPDLRSPHLRRQSRGRRPVHSPTFPEQPDPGRAHQSGGIQNPFVLSSAEFSRPAGRRNPEFPAERHRRQQRSQNPRPPGPRTQ
jgi:hypothetical protein